MTGVGADAFAVATVVGWASVLRRMLVPRSFIS